MDNVKSFDFLYDVMRDGYVSPSHISVFFKFYWPDFVKFSGFYFFLDCFSSDRCLDLIGKGEDPEIQVNLINVSSYFSDSADCLSKSKQLFECLKEIWLCKLGQDYPQVRFDFKCIEKDDQVFITFNHRKS